MKLEDIRLKFQAKEAAALSRRGRDGVNGIDGRAGLNGVGIRGEKGERGERGSDGSNGSVGARGERGFAGEKGDLGLRGLQGEKGEDGRDGRNGATGGGGTSRKQVNKQIEEWLLLNGYLPYNTNIVTTDVDYDILPTDSTVKCFGAASFTLQLLPVSDVVDGKEYNIKHTGTGVLKLVAAEDEFIDGLPCTIINAGVAGAYPNRKIKKADGEWLII